MTKVVNRFPSVLDRVNMYPKTASVACSSGDITTITSGYVARATSSSPWLLGISRETWDAADATNGLVPVQEDEFGLWEIDSAVTLVQATHVGNAYDLTDHDTLNPGATTYKVLTVLGITVSGRALCRPNMHAGSVGHK